MSENQQDRGIHITGNGPYLVTGGIPLTEQIITPSGRGYVFRDGRALPQSDTYELCRCGESRTAPFCDGSHVTSGFDGTETASKARYDDRAKILVGPELDLADDGRCALARFCHTSHGDVWHLTEHSDNPRRREEAIAGASACPTGRLTAVSKTGEAFEPHLAPGISTLQDPEKDVSSGIYVKGGIPITSADGEVYEIRNRVTLCRCGASRNKPFCDASHLRVRYSDGD